MAEVKIPSIYTTEEHKVYLLIPEKAKATELMDFLKEQLQLSNIKKSEVPAVLLEMSIIEDYWNMGMKNRANDHIFSIMARFMVSKSVSGVGLITQVGEIKGNTSMRPDETAEIGMEGYTAEQDKKPVPLLTKIKDSIMGKSDE